MPVEILRFPGYNILIFDSLFVFFPEGMDDGLVTSVNSQEVGFIQVVNWTSKLEAPIMMIPWGGQLF